MASIRVDYDDRELRRGLRRVSAYLDNLQPFHDDVGAYVERSTDDRFRTETGPDGTPWRSLANSTLATKRNRKTLQETGKMRDSLSYTANAREAIVGFSDKKARWHQLGTNPYTIEPRRASLLRFMGANGPVFARRVNHPGLLARPMLGISYNDEREILAIARDHVESRFGD
jgi:phage gpG-like protein